MNVKTPIFLAVSWVVSTVLLVMFAGYVGIALQQNVILAILGLGLYWAFITFLSRVHILHFGHVWLVAGGFLILFGFGFLYGGVGLENYKQQWWNLSIPQLGIFTIAFLLGAIFLLFGLVQMWRNQYFLMRRR